MNKLAKLLTEESRIAFTSGMVYEGAIEVSALLIKTVELAFAKGVSRGFKIGFVGGVAACGIGTLAYKRYKKSK